MNLYDIIKYAIDRGASDIHLGAGLCPKIRIDSDLIDTDFSPTDDAAIRSLMGEVLTPERMTVFNEKREYDFSFHDQEVGSFRVNLFMQKGQIGVAVRILPSRIWSFEECGLPGKQLKQFADAPNGLLLVTGATGSGKTTTLAAMVEHINQTKPCHIITIEDPIEFVFTNSKSKIDQREIGRDTDSFYGALRYVLRQDPDVVLIGEMRDPETIETALAVAETGHLVMATLHTSDSISTINRIIDVFPEHKQQQVRTQLSFVLNAVIAQRLVPKIGGGRNLVHETLIANSAVRSMIRDEKVHQIYSILQTGKKAGMQSMNQSLADLILAGKANMEDVMKHSSNIEELMDLTGRG